MKERRQSTVKFETCKNQVVVASLMNHGKRYVGAAKCSPEDTFDLEIGKKLAEARANKKSVQADIRYWKSQKKAATIIIQQFERSLAYWKMVSEKADKEVAEGKTLIEDINKVLYPHRVK